MSGRYIYHRCRDYVHNAVYPASVQNGTADALLSYILYEIKVALWEFMISASLGILFRSEGFLDRNMPEYMAAVWIVRILMLVIAFLAVKAGEGRNRIISTWIIFSMLILVAVLFFYLTRQYEMEKKIAHLEKEKNALLMRDYQFLKNTYAVNARLFHDFHNHIEALHCYLEKDRTAEAVRYLESLRSPIEAVTHAVNCRIYRYVACEHMGFALHCLS